MTLLIAAISLGFLGSLHCLGMCGPIALALPINTASVWGRVIGIISYNIGRVFTYGLLGGLFGLIGQSFAMGGFQQLLSIAIGILILISVLIPEHIASRFRITSMVYSSIAKLKSKMGTLFLQKNMFSLLSIGLLNGLLPCGLVYTAIAGAIATGNSLTGSFFMIAFGLGTIPAMMSVSLLKNNITQNSRNKINKLIPVFVVTMAVILILRGLNLGIPYISPKISSSPKEHTMTCCHKK